MKSVVFLASDKSGNMWILGSDGVLRRYSFLDGFTSPEGLPSEVKTLAVNPESGLVFASVQDALFVWKSEDNPPVPSRVCSLPSPVVSFAFASDEAVWLTLENALYRLDKSGSLSLVSETPEDGDISKLIHFKIETSAGITPWVWVFVAFLLGLALAYPVSLLLKNLNSKKPEKTAASIPTKPVTPSPLAPVIQAPVKPVTPDPIGSLPVVSDSSSDTFVAEVERIIRDNIATQKFGVDEIAEITGVSRIHVNRKLKAAGAPSPSVMLKKARMEAAAKLVAEAKVPMQEIALRCGFSSASYFATSFRDYFGVPPTEYKV